MLKMSWKDSRNYCLRKGGDLVSILNSSEVEFIYNQTSVRGNSRFWIGLYRNKTAGDTKKGWIWSDGNDFKTYQQWDKRQPDNKGNNENCAEILRRSRFWNDNDCSGESNSICKRRKGSAYKLL